MSSSTGVYYSVAMQEARREAENVGREKSRLTVLAREQAELAVECAAFAETYAIIVEAPTVPKTKGQTTSAELAATANTFQNALDAAKKNLATSRASEHRRRLLEHLASLDDGSVLPPLPTRVRESEPAEAPAETVPDRVRRYLSALAPEVELSERFRSLAESLAVSTGDVGSALRALQAEVARLNREGRAKSNLATSLRELEVRAGVLGEEGAAARASVTAAQRSLATIGTAVLIAVEGAVSTAEDAAALALRRGYVESTVGGILDSLGYRDLGGFETAVPKNGRLVTKASWPHHGVMYQVDGEEISFKVVRTALDPNPDLAATRDLDVETAFCDQVPELLEQLSSHGVNPDRDRRIAPGVTRPHVLAGATVLATESSTSKRAKPLEKSL